jgi:RNA exonuclease 4
MAVYRLHRKEWEKGNKGLAKPGESGKKRKRHKVNEGKTPEAGSDEDGDGEKVKSEFPGGGRKGVSSGLTTTVMRRGANARSRAIGSGGSRQKKTEWWKELASSSKGT